LNTKVDCGRSGHTDDCLCDVVVTNPVQVRYAPHEVLYADIVIKYQNLGTPWTAKDLADLWDGLGKAADAFATLNGRVDAPPSDYKPVITRLLSDGHSMVDIPEMVGITLEQCGLAVASGRHTVLASWEEGDWLAWEADLGVLGGDRLAVKHNVSRKLAHKLKNLYFG
jgi:hypothetical protein